MEQNEIERRIALLENNVMLLQKDNEILSKTVDNLEKQLNDQRVINERILNKLDTIDTRMTGLCERIDETKKLAEKTEGKSKLDVVSLIAVIITGFLATGGAMMLQTFIK